MSSEAYHGVNLFWIEISGCSVPHGFYQLLHVSQRSFEIQFFLCDICSLVELVVLVFAAQFLQPRLFQYLIFVDLGVVTKVGTMVSFIGMFGVFGCSIIVDKLSLVFKSMGL